MVVLELLEVVGLATGLWLVVLVEVLASLFWAVVWVVGVVLVVG